MVIKAQKNIITYNKRLAIMNDAQFLPESPGPTFPVVPQTLTKITQPTKPIPVEII